MADFQGAALRVEGLCVRFGEQTVLRDVSFDVEPNATLAVIGASGCGKTTLLRAIAGLVIADRGQVLLGGRRVERMPVNRRGIVYLNQEPLLFPHLSLFDNIAFGLHLRKLPVAVVRARVEALLLRLGLNGLADRNPDELSGGQRQRTAFGRALAVEPGLLLLDEPFSSLDPYNRSCMQALFKQVAREHGIASLFVTHDVKECLRIGDRFAILRNGRLTLYGDSRAFAADPLSGVAREAEFWRAYGGPAGGQDL